VTQASRPLPGPVISSVLAGLAGFASVAPGLFLLLSAARGGLCPGAPAGMGCPIQLWEWGGLVLVLIGCTFLASSVVILQVPQAYLPVGIAMVMLGVVGFWLATWSPAMFPPVAPLFGVAGGVVTLLFARPRRVRSAAPTVSA
jgi:hypothetical protein